MKNRLAERERKREREPQAWDGRREETLSKPHLCYLIQTDVAPRHFFLLYGLCFWLVILEDEAADSYLNEFATADTFTRVTPSSAGPDVS